MPTNSNHHYTHITTEQANDQTISIPSPDSHPVSSPSLSLLQLQLPHRTKSDREVPTLLALDLKQIRHILFVLYQSRFIYRIMHPLFMR